MCSPFVLGCVVKYRAVGCYDDDMIDPRPLPKYIMNERDPTAPSYNGHLIDWVNWDTYYIQFICRCASKAKLLGYRYFSAQYYGIKFQIFM